MCRIFGFRSILNSQVHESLVNADNALGIQSSRHPDGWGVSYYHNNHPHIIKSDQTAINDSIFKHVSGIVSSQTVLAHIRKATYGETSILNTHPFQFGQWTFAHNGNIKDFSKVKDQLISHIPDAYKRYIIGSTDSEVVFYYLLSKLTIHIDINDPDPDLYEVMEGLKEAIAELVSITGDLCLIDGSCPQTENYLTFILTNGSTMIAFNGGQQLYYSTYKTKCSEAQSCPSYSPECENATQSGYVNHLIFSSEPLQNSNIWIKVKPLEMIGINGKMKIKHEVLKL